MMLHPARLAALLLLPLALTFAACDDGNTQTTPQDDVAEDVAQDTEAPDTAAPDVPTGPDYPPGPYGYTVGSTVPNIELYDPFTSKWIAFSDYYKRYDKRVLFVSSAAGWCGPCRAEAVELVRYYDQFEGDGLEPLYSLYEDTNGTALQIGDTNAATFMTGWRDEFGVDYPLLMDPPRDGNDPNSFGLLPFYEDNAVPFAFMITTHDMQIRWKVHGYDPGAIQFQILSNLDIVKAYWDEQAANQGQ